ncbi:inner-membrane translocator [Thermoanaerobacterium thermosaccharolyticum DSM 571]|uniref:Xylose transport system permease protein XylH n=1 Tax=Thermoanaerobacterium thermosaccharolyticum (strain ATCC 7956 / DSM 571 / NCIMB 9385 / NCA 3814 / NCTC 13789 / WDCM 00135 / 2032) TaxID=580327 RepID=D9TTQ4_THETC|nr:sugar ABC transporter permease [Thermoanaerobacterium thermosaccharolyticum]ADL69944.1 inner-membrane translocator [Thermoanaerobacterium thermosaccharolyticum DSM 571]
MVNSKGFKENNVSINKKFSFNLKLYTMIIALVGIWIIFAIATKGDFLTSRNMSNLFRQMVSTAVLAIGMVFVIIAGQIDLSVGSLLGLTGGIAAIANVWFHINGILSIIIALAIGLILGTWNGWWVAYKNVPSFIVTLAGMLVFRGILIGITNGYTIAPLSSDFQFIGQAYLTPVSGYLLGIIVLLVGAYTIYSQRKSKIKYGLEVSPFYLDIAKIILMIVLIGLFVFTLNSYNGIPFSVLILAILVAIFTYIASKTVFGRRVYALGGNIEAAKLSGINVKKITLILFAINGLLAAVSGVVLTSTLNAGSTSAGQNAEMDAIASCVIGGASLMGGVGSVIGAIIGALVMASINNGMSLLNSAPFWQYVVKGLILLLAVYVDVASKNKE